MSILAERYASPQMREIWSREQKVLLERELWILIMKEQSRQGFPIPKSAIDSYEKVWSEIDLASIDKRESILKHDLKARIEEFNALAGHEYIHLGLTSRDVTDNVELLQIKLSLQLIQKKMQSLLVRLAVAAEMHAELVMIGRTHNVPAQVTTLGKRFSTWAEELYFASKHLDELLVRLPLRGIKGAIGTSLDQIELLGASGHEIEKKLLSSWHFNSVLFSPSQVYPRSIDFEVVSTLAQVAATPSTIATNIRLMSGFGLLTEGFATGQVGSSAMPHKVNPRLSERVHSLVVILNGFVSMASQISGQQWNEGDVSCSAVRRVILPDSFHVTDGILDTIMSIIDHLQINNENIDMELKLHLPLMLSTKILILAVKRGVGRERAHELIKGHSQHSSPVDFLERIVGDSELKLSLSELRELLADPLELAGDAPNQARGIAKMIKETFLNTAPSGYKPNISN